ncbi:MAG: AAA family ATPase [Phascolarctobacterium sp.]|nr:AAA family ATPase [Phascolarctobacterium sp.]
MTNPFSLGFGKEPQSYIEQNNNLEIIESFNSDNPEAQVCILTGVRGSGKTVTMTSIANKFREESNWIVVDLNPERNLLEMLLASFYRNQSLKSIFSNAKFNLSIPGIGGVEFNKENKFEDPAIILEDLLDELSQNGKKLLITIDEISNNQNVREFVSQFQIYIRKNYNVFLIMTGLYENVYDLQNEKTLTFLYRAPKIYMEPLSLSLIMLKYQEVFSLDSNTALKMAEFTKGYPYAYQVLGNLCFKRNCSYEKVIDEYDIILRDYVYKKIWSELSSKDKTVLQALIKTPNGKAEDVRNILAMEKNVYSVYRDRLLKKGIVKVSEYGCLELTLPRFKEFIEASA